MTCILSFVFGEGFGYPKRMPSFIKCLDVFVIYFNFVDIVGIRMKRLVHVPNIKKQFTNQ